MLSWDNPNYNETFLTEFIEDYVSSAAKFEPFGVHPQLTEKVLAQLIKLSQTELFVSHKASLIIHIERIENQKEVLRSVLEGKSSEERLEQKVFFPLVIGDAEEGFYGVLESSAIHIRKSTDADKFIIVPSEKEIEKKIIQQCKDSWYQAISISKSYVRKPHPYHEVIISFDKKEGFYEGNSLGIALTISYLEQILNFYNPTYIIKTKELTAFTGGITERGKVMPTGEEIIKQKVRAVFFSEMNSFVIPKEDEGFALDELNNLKTQYPKRNLKLIPIEDVTDVLNRRDLVEIKKQKLVVRTGKFVKKNWVSAVVTVLLAVFFAYLFVVDWDDNPALLAVDENTLFVKNNNGKTLWSKKVNLPHNAKTNKRILFQQCRIFDIDGDGRNEVLIVGEDETMEKNNVNSDAELRCYNKYGRIIWKYSFSDSVRSERELLKPFYSIYMIDTINIYNQRSLFLISNNIDSFSSAVYRIDTKTGKRLTGTIWCSGFTLDCIIKDIDGDGKKDILSFGVDNGFEEIVIFAVEIGAKTSVRPSTTEYTIKGFPLAILKNYIRLPKTDYDNYLGIRMSGIERGSLRDGITEKRYEFSTTPSDPQKESHLWIKIDYNLKDFNVIVDNQYRIIRDSLVAQSKLKPPYSDTKEYIENYKSKILYWKNSKWVRRDELN